MSMTSVQAVATKRSAAERESLILEHMPQVRMIARKICEKVPENVTLDDLISAGTVGLIHAIDRFDSSLGVKLKTYAEYKIRGAIIDSLRTIDWAPRQQRRRARLIESAASQVEKKLHRKATEEEIAAELGICVTVYREWTSDTHCLTVGSLESTAPGEDGRELMQFVAAGDSSLPSKLVEDSELQKLVGTAMSRMPQPERSVLDMYYHQEMTLREISQKMDLHESRISQLKTQGISRLRTLLATRWPNRGSLAAHVA